MQSTTFLLVLWVGEDFFDTSFSDVSELPGDSGSSYSRRHHTVLFNVFVLSQLINEINARKVGPVFNVFARMEKHKLFMGVWLAALGVQILMIQFGGDVVKVEVRYASPVSRLLSSVARALCSGLTCLSPC